MTSTSAAFVQNIALTATSVFFLAVATTSVAMAVGRTLPAAGSTLASVLPLADAHSLSARADIARHELEAAKQATRAELGVSPVREGAWLRLAKLDVVQHGRLSPVGLDALSRAYDVAPYDLTRDGARRRFVAVHLGELPPDLRVEVDQEVAALAR